MRTQAGKKVLTNANASTAASTNGAWLTLNAFTTAQFSFRPETEDVISGPEKGATAVPRFDQLWSPAQEAGRPAGSFIFSEKISLDTQAVGSNRVTGYHHDYGK